MNPTQIVTIGSDGLRLAAQARLAELAGHKDLAEFATGLVSQALAETALNQTLAQAVYRPDSAGQPLVTALLALDAAVEIMVDQKRWALSLPGFLSYRASFPPQDFPMPTLLLPPLNPDGHYHFKPMAEGGYLATRLDLHPSLRVLGHVRLALSRPGQLPRRLPVAEQRLDRQFLHPDLVNEALASETLVLSPAEQATLSAIFSSLLQEPL
jgi:CO/xanthine dehydrogenase FAD-binding subunit